MIDKNAFYIKNGKVNGYKNGLKEQKLTDAQIKLCKKHKVDIYDPVEDELNLEDSGEFNLDM